MSTQSASRYSSQIPYHISSVSGDSSSDGGSHTPGPIYHPSSIPKPFVSLHTRPKVVFVHPLEATIARNFVDSPPQAIFFNRALSDPQPVDISSALEDDEVMLPLGSVLKIEGEISQVYAGEQPLFQ